MLFSNLSAGQSRLKIDAQFGREGNLACLSHRLGECLLNRPSALNAPDKSRMMDAKFAGPICNVLPLPIELKKMARVLVSLLGSIVGPSAIRRLVVPSDIDAVDGGARRALTHVCEKVIEHQPALAYRGASGAIFPVSGVRRVSASSQHRLPSAEGRRPAATCVAVPKIGRDLAFALKAAARFDGAFKERRSHGVLFDSTVATTRHKNDIPCSARRWPDERLADYREPAVAAPDRGSSCVAFHASILQDCV